MSELYKDTINWDQYWIDDGENKAMIAGSEKMAKRIGIFIDRYSINHVADFGCGSGRTLFLLAKKYPDLKFSGFDSAISIISKNRSRAKELKLDNIKFECEFLPNIKTKIKFDLIFCIASLHYVRDIKKAILELYDRISNKGFLIFNYPNRYSMYWYRNWIKRDDIDQRKRFSLVLNGSNLLTLPEIESLLKRRARNFWLTVGEKSDRANMAVVIQK